MALKTDKQEKDLAAREAAVAERENDVKALLKALKGAKVFSTDLEARDPQELPKLMLSELGLAEAGIQTEPAPDLNLAAFMEEPVLLYVHPDTTPGSLDVILPTVNGINMPIIRGKDQWVKRKYVEALARSRITAYTQQVPDASRPENIQMVPATQLTYPFSVREDKNPQGRAWLENIIRQQA